jgi:DNA-binding transcriptional ArsR family regulator
MAYHEVFVALADPTRRNVFEALQGQPMTVGELARDQPVSRPAVSQHLRVLESANLVSVTPKGNRRFYTIRREGLNELQRYLENFWSDALSSYAAEVERRMDSTSEREGT